LKGAYREKEVWKKDKGESVPENLECHLLQEQCFPQIVGGAEGKQKAAGVPQEPQRTLVKIFEKLGKHLIRQHLQGTNQNAGIATVMEVLVAQGLDSEWV